MNQDQVKSGIRWVVSTFGAVLAGYFAAWSGWFSADQITGALTSETFLSIAASIAMGIWGLIARTDKNMVAAVSAIPEVKSMTLTDPALSEAAKTADPTTNVTLKPASETK